jgi:hypothetical protein
LQAADAVDASRRRGRAGEPFAGLDAVTGEPVTTIHAGQQFAEFAAGLVGMIEINGDVP